MTAPYFAGPGVTLHQGDAREVLSGLDTGSVDCCVTSPPYYGLRDYGHEDQLGLENTPGEYVAKLAAVFHELQRVLADDGTLWLNIGDSYSTRSDGSGGTGKSTLGVMSGGGVDNVLRSQYRQQASDTQGRARGYRALDRTFKNMLGIPWRVAFALQDDGWILRNANIWAKTNPMPSSVTDRFSSTYETVFMFSKGPRYYFDLDAVRVPHVTLDPSNPSYRKNGKSNARNKFPEVPNSPLQTLDRRPSDPERGKNPGDVWSIATRAFSGAHFATMPPAIVERCVRAGCRPAGVVLDPFSGSGTTGMVALAENRSYVGIDVSSEFLDLSLQTRLVRP